MLLLGHKTDDKYIEELQSNFPQDLMKYRYLMHPTRLMMIKLLYSEYSLSSIEVQRVLKISWGAYTSHIKSLEKHGYIEIKEKFSEDATIKQMIFLSDHARKEYETLLELLEDFVEKKTPLDYIINSDSDSYMTDDLYPKD